MEEGGVNVRRGKGKRKRRRMAPVGMIIPEIHWAAS